MSEKSVDSPSVNPNSETESHPIKQALDGNALGEGLKKIVTTRIRKRRQLSIMGAKQSLTLSIRRRYVERARIVSEYMGISLSTYMERLITKDNARYTRVINLLTSEVKKHDDVIAKIDEATRHINPLDILNPKARVQDADIEQAMRRLAEINGQTARAEEEEDFEDSDEDEELE